jgi:hypothetical protein
MNWGWEKAESVRAHCYVRVYIRAFFLLFLCFGMSVLVSHTYAVKGALGIGQDLAAWACS